MSMATIQQTSMGHHAAYLTDSADTGHLRQEQQLATSALNPRGLAIYNQTTSPIKVKGKVFESTTSIGLRPSQEDRLVLVPRLFNEDIAFCSVFDGTVGHHASEFLMSNILEHLCRRPELERLLRKTDEINAMLRPDLSHPSIAQKDDSVPINYEEIAGIIHDALRQAFLDADSALINMCARQNFHYASSTGVCTLIWKNLLTVAHVGDSKACIARVAADGAVHPEWLTVDHKPNMPAELKRIQESGGSLVWLHGNKPYIRGGDFLRRQANGEHPKQLNYSRAFGGKDLKMFGLSAEPDINHFEITNEDKVVLIASDGLWDVLSPKFACELAIQAKKHGRSATEEIVARAIHEMPHCNVADNITVIAIFLNEV